MRPRRSHPPHPWSGTGASPSEVCSVLGQLLRDQDVDLVRSLGSDPAAVRGMDALVARHKVGPYLKRRLEASPVLHALPFETQARIEAAADRQREMAARSLTALEDVGAALGAASVPFLLVKGLEMAQRLFGGIAHRGFWDLDVLVREADRERAFRALESRGFTKTSSVFLSDRLAAGFVHAFDFVRSDRSLDLHWSLSRLPGLRPDDEALFSRAEWIELGGQRIRVLALEDELHFVLISVFADIQRGAMRLQSFVDLFALIRDQPDMDWSAFFDRRKTERTDSVCRAVLRLFLSALGLEGRFESLSDAIGPEPPPETIGAIVESSPVEWRAKLWASRHLPVSPGFALAWWFGSLPFRVAASHPRFRRRVKDAKTS